LVYDRRLLIQEIAAVIDRRYSKLNHHRPPGSLDLYLILLVESA
jgi:hypothetical protein